MKSVTRVDPTRGMMHFDPFRDFEDLFRGLRVRPWTADAPTMPDLRLDLAECDDAYRARVELPGVNKEDIDVSVDGNLVTVSADVKREAETKEGTATLYSERYFGRVSRSFAVRHDVDETRALASYKDGVLELTLPKKTDGPVRRLAIS
jgi:HSP20 family protein